MSGLRLFAFKSMVIPTDNRKGLCNVFKEFCVVLDTTRGILKSFLKNFKVYAVQISSQKAKGVSRTQNEKNHQGNKLYNCQTPPS